MQRPLYSLMCVCVFVFVCVCVFVCVFVFVASTRSIPTLDLYYCAYSPGIPLSTGEIKYTKTLSFYGHALIFL